MAISCFERPEAATAVRAMKDGAKPRLTKAKAPFFRKTRRETIQPPCRGRPVCRPGRTRRSAPTRYRRWGPTRVPARADTQVRPYALSSWGPTRVSARSSSSLELWCAQRERHIFWRVGRLGDGRPRGLRDVARKRDRDRAVDLRALDLARGEP